jgi:hypothetical protein
MLVSRLLSYGARHPGYIFCSLVLSVLLAGVLLASCSNPFASAQASPTATALPANLPLAKLKWCSNKPDMLFRDEGAVPTDTVTATATATPTTPTVTATSTPVGSPTVTPTATASVTLTIGPGTPTTITDWNVVKADLGFTVFLPVNLPRDACLVSAQATVHDPTFGGSFLIGYLLPDHTSLTFSEAPLTSQNTSFQCNVSNSSTAQASSLSAAGTSTPQAATSPTPVPLQLCSGARNTTSIVLSARRSVAYLQQAFNALQGDVTWIPAS